jgi:hypothetical protein
VEHCPSSEHGLHCQEGHGVDRHNTTQQPNPTQHRQQHDRQHADRDSEVFPSNNPNWRQACESTTMLPLVLSWSFRRSWARFCRGSGFGFPENTTVYVSGAVEVQVRMEGTCLSFRRPHAPEPTPEHLVAQVRSEGNSFGLRRFLSHRLKKWVGSLQPCTRRGFYRSHPPPPPRASPSPRSNL